MKNEETNEDFLAAKEDLLAYVEEQSALWNVVFCIVYMQKMKINDRTTEFNPADVIYICKNDDDLQTILDVITIVDDKFDDVEWAYQQSVYKPLPWQRDLVEEISSKTEYLSTVFDIGTISEVVSIAVIDGINVQAIIDKLDKRYFPVLQSCIAKMKILKRNFIMTMEIIFGSKVDADESLTFDKLLEAYIDRHGLETVIKAYKHALTAQASLTEEEQYVLSYAFPCHTLQYKMDLHDPSMQEASIVWQAERKVEFDEDSVIIDPFSPIDNDDGVEGEDDDDESEDMYEGEYDDDDDDDDDEYEYDEEKYIPTYIDVTERILFVSHTPSSGKMEISIREAPFEGIALSDLDFLLFNGKMFITIKVVDDTSQHPMGQFLSLIIDQLNEQIDTVTQDLVKENDLSKIAELRKQLHNAKELLKNCYLVDF